MLMFLGFIVLIACLVIGVRRGGIGLATISGIGLVFFIFVMGLKPGKRYADNYGGGYLFSIFTGFQRA